MAKEGFDYARAKAEVGDQFPPPEQLSEKHQRLWTGAVAVLLRNRADQPLQEPIPNKPLFEYKKVS